MARRRVPEPARIGAGEIPEELQSMAGVREFHDPHEAAPEWVPAGERAAWRYLNAWMRWRAARRRWCADNGLDYVATFWPAWLDHQ